MLLEQIAGLKVERTPPEDLKLSQDWHSLWNRAPRATIFQSPVWLLTWQRYFGGNDPWLITFREEDRLVGLAPFQRWTTDRRRMIFLGTGISDSLDILSEPTVGRRVAAALFEFLYLHRDEWHLCELEQVPGTSPIVMETVPDKWRSSLQMQDVCPILNLPATPEHLARYRELKQLQRRLERTGPVTFDVAGRDNFTVCFDALVSLHTARWEARGQCGVLDENKVQDFHRELAEQFLQMGLLRLYVLRVGDMPVAAWYGFHHRGRTVYYLGGFDPDWAERSVGTIIVGFAIERAIKERAVEFDFLRGAERYKYRWGARDRFTYRRVIEQ